MIVIADSGSTKTQWVLLDKAEVIVDITTKGFNPYYYEAKELEHDLFNELQGKIDSALVDKVFFYGSGCSTESNCLLVKNSLQLFFKDADIHTEHDLTGTATALFQNKKGIACILGTGSNSCLWDGHNVIENVPSLGWLLADDGSGTHIGKLFLTAILYGDASDALTEKFYKTYELDFESTLHKLYSESNPNKFFASLSKFVGENISHPECKKAVEDSFTSFVEHQLSKYTDYQKLTVSFVGSVAYVYRDILKTVLDTHQINTGVISQRPMEGLIRYHAS